MLIAPGLFGLGVGTALGLVGAGGSILAVPALVYGLSMPVGEAVTTSLIVVAGTAAAAVVPRMSRKEVRWPVAGVFGAAGAAAAVGGAAVNRLLPERWLLAAFGLLMVVVGVRLLGRQPEARGACRLAAGRINWRTCLPKALLIGAGVGFLTGLFGVGGGFVVVPALIWLLGLAMPVAIGTSLVVVMINSAAGLAAHLGRFPVNMAVAGVFVATAAVAAVTAGQVAGRLPEYVLRRGFALLVIAVGGFVAVQSALGQAAIT